MSRTRIVKAKRRHTTYAGRIVYDRPKHVFTLQDYRRLTRFFLTRNRHGDPLGEFLNLWEVLWSVFREVLGDSVRDQARRIDYITNGIIPRIIWDWIAGISEWAADAAERVAAAVYAQLQTWIVQLFQAQQSTSNGG